MGLHSCLIYLHKVDFAQFLEYNKSLTTASELTLWLSGQSIGLVAGQPGVDSQPGLGNIFSYALHC